jgi:hypothetical protein
MKRALCLVGLVWIVGFGAAVADPAPVGHLAGRPMSKNAGEVFEQSMRLFDASYDAKVRLVLHPQDRNPPPRGRYMVRESSWYALGLMMRNRGDDARRARAILGAVLDEQYPDPGVKWYGTFKRTPEEPSPAAGDRSFTSYDPNWRQFIGTILEMLLLEYPDRLPVKLKARMYRSIDAAIDGEIHDGRLVPSYSNIALMHGALWDFAAAHNGKAEWKTGSAAWTAEVYRLFSQHNSFNEYNAPTYYGVDLYGLALWREYGSTAAMQEMGRAMEAALWNDIADFYQPALRNVAGPYDRAYGMDMSVYVTPTGVWMRTLLDGEHAPLPLDARLSTFQVADIWFAPQIVLLQTRIPAEALNKLQHFRGPHLVRRQIDPNRIATAWIGEGATWGGEFTSRTRDTGTSQFHPATVHWRMPSGEIGWIKVTRSPMIDAEADRGGIGIQTDGDLTLRIYAGGRQGAFADNIWKLPGLTVEVNTDGHDFSATKSADCEDCDDVSYKQVHKLRMTLTPE